MSGSYPMICWVQAFWGRDTSGIWWLPLKENVIVGMACYE
jgi:hypothetical protein